MLGPQFLIDNSQNNVLIIKRNVRRLIVTILFEIVFTALFLYFGFKEIPKEDSSVFSTGILYLILLGFGYEIISNIVKIIRNNEIEVKKRDKTVYKNKLPLVQFSEISNISIREISDSDNDTTYNISLKGEKNIVIGKGMNREEGNHLAELLALYMDKEIVNL